MQEPELDPVQVAAFEKEVKNIVADFRKLHMEREITLITKINKLYSEKKELRTEIADLKQQIKNK